MDKKTLYLFYCITLSGMGTQAYAEYRDLGVIAVPAVGATEVKSFNVSHSGDEASEGNFTDVFTFTLDEDAVVAFTLVDLASSLVDVRDTITKLYVGEAEYAPFPGDSGLPFPTFAGAELFEALDNPVRSGDLALGAGTYSIFVVGIVPVQEDGNGQYSVDISVSEVPISTTPKNTPEPTPIAPPQPEPTPVVVRPEPRPAPQPEPIAEVPAPAPAPEPTPEPAPTPVVGNAQLSWTIPTKRENGDDLWQSELGRFEVYYTTESGKLYTIPVDNVSQTSLNVSNLESGAYQFVMVAIDKDGIFSELSNSVSKTVE